MPCALALSLSVGHRQQLRMTRHFIVGSVLFYCCSMWVRLPNPVNFEGATALYGYTSCCCLPTMGATAHIFSTCFVMFNKGATAQLQQMFFTVVNQGATAQDLSDFCMCRNSVCGYPGAIPSWRDCQNCSSVCATVPNTVVFLGCLHHNCLLQQVLQLFLLLAHACWLDALPVAPVWARRHCKSGAQHGSARWQSGEGECSPPAACGCVLVVVAVASSYTMQLLLLMMCSCQMGAWRCGVACCWKLLHDELQPRAKPSSIRDELFVWLQLRHLVSGCNNQGHCFRSFISC